MSGRAAARLGDLGLDRKRKNTAPAIHGSKNVFINGREAVRVGDAYALPVGGQLASGSPTVFINGRQAGRIGDDIAGATIDTTGSPNVFIGDSSPIGSRKPFREKCEECAPSAADVPVPAEKPEPVEEEKTSCDLITAEKLKTVWPRALDANLQIFAEELNYSINIGLIDSRFRLAHFLGQVGIESMFGTALKENLYYTTADRLAKVWRVFRAKGGGPNKLAHDIIAIQDRDKRIQSIASHAYSGRNGNGDAASGDGGKFIGRGLKQVTGRTNYTAFNDAYVGIWGEEMVEGAHGLETAKFDFVNLHWDLLEQPKYAVRSALWFWKANGLAIKADEGMTRAVADKITNVINPGIDDASRKVRWEAAEKVYNSKEFENICFNTSDDLNNKKAKEPKKKKNEQAEGENRKSEE